MQKLGWKRALKYRILARVLPTRAVVWMLSRERNDDGTRPGRRLT